MDSKKIALLSSEVAPFAKTGGLADVAAALARALVPIGHDVRVFMPLYRRVKDSGVELVTPPELTDFSLQMGARAYRFSVSTGKIPDSDAPVYFVDCPELFDRPGIYGSGADEAVRFGLLSRAALETCQRLQWAPDVVHCNDWHTALVPIYLKTLYDWDQLFEGTRTVLTLHNVGYQGVFSDACLADLGLAESKKLLYQEDVQGGVFNFLKTGILYADALTTVSQTYAREIQTPEQGFGLDSILRARADTLFGIVNGVDYDVWNPATDSVIAANYTPDDLSGKSTCRAALLDEVHLAPDPRGPVLGIVSRLTGQKGFELLPDVLPVLLQSEDVRLVVLGSGEESYEKYFQWLRDTYPQKVGIFRGYNDALAHRIEAGSDCFLMPSRYEPCGLNQMYSLKYGSVPIVRRTGGLADTVAPFDPHTGEGTGFLFDEFSSEALLDAMRRALAVWRDPAAWSRLRENGMRRDFSWERQAAHYIELYDLLTSHAQA